MLFVGRRSVMAEQAPQCSADRAGTGLLWFGWYGFNAGSELRVDAVTASAFLNTDVAASFAGVTWLVIEWIYAKRPKFVGLLTGTVAGLATITPAAGYVSISSAAIFGVLAERGLLLRGPAQEPNGLGRCARRMGRARRRRLSRHRSLGGVRLDGLESGRRRRAAAWRRRVFPQTASLPYILCAVWAFVFTYGMLWLIDRVTVTRTDPASQERGLDEELHGEEAYPQGL